MQCIGLNVIKNRRRMMMKKDYTAKENILGYNILFDTAESEFPIWLAADC